MAVSTLAVPSNNLLGGVTAAPSPSSVTNNNTTPNAANFLALLTTELKNQDPLNPVDSTQSVAQLAQFSALQATTSLSNNFANFESNFSVEQASGLLGDTVSVATSDAGGNASTISGTVKSIQVINGAPQFTMVAPGGKPIVDANGNPLQFGTSQIVAIGK